MHIIFDKQFDKPVNLMDNSAAIICQLLKQIETDIFERKNCNYRNTLKQAEK